MSPKPALIVQVAIDGSGCVHRDRFIAYGTVAALNPEWHQFHGAWGQLLDRHALDHIRCADAMHFEGAFRDKYAEWGGGRDGRRDAILMEAAEIIRKHLEAGGASLDFEGLPSEKLFRYRKKLMFQHVIRKLLAGADPSYYIALMCDDEQDAAPDYYRFVNNLKQKYPVFRRQLGGICFFDDVRMSQLQAADMMAYVLRERLERERLRPDERESELEKALLDGLGTQIEQMTLAVLEKTEKAPHLNDDVV